VIARQTRNHYQVCVLKSDN